MSSGIVMDFWRPVYSLKCVLELVTSNSCSSLAHAKLKFLENTRLASGTSSKAKIFSRIITANTTDKAARTDPSQKCSMKFSVGLPQPAYKGS